MEPFNDQATDELLIWRAFKSGDEAAFGEIYRTQVQGLLNYGNKINPDRQQVQDSVQDLFIELWNSRERLKDTNAIKFYLFRALRNKLSKLSRPNHSFLLDNLHETLALPQSSVARRKGHCDRSYFSDHPSGARPF